MGEVVALPSSHRGASRQRDLVGAAEILFFTGVRYYRMSDDEFARLSAPRGTGAGKPARKIKKRA